MMPYFSAYEWLFSLVTDPAGERFFRPKTAAVRQQEMTHQIERTGRFLQFIGHPEQQFPAVHITGTSGKGSVTLITAALLQACGQPVGHHTSPYLQLPLEKLVLNGRWISPTAFAQLIHQFRAHYEQWLAAGQEPLRYGEAWVVLTFLWFAQQSGAWGVVEAGMGGRFDPTNLLPAECAIITNVAYDHVLSLGPTLADIAWHKAGIIKPGQTAITGVKEPELWAVVQQEAQQKGAQLLTLGREFTYQTTAGQTTITTPLGTFGPLHGREWSHYQQENLALAVMAVAHLAHQHQFELTTAHIQHVLDTLVFPGRFEMVQQNPSVILDGAHNPHKMHALAQALQQKYPGRLITAVVGGIANKDMGEMMRHLAPQVTHWVATQPHVPGKPALPLPELEAILRSVSVAPITTTPSVLEILPRLLSQARPEDIIVVTGSLYLVGEARHHWHPLDQLLQQAEHF